MARYRVGFDGEWQGDFETEADAVEWGSGVGETGRTVYVVRYAGLSRKLVAVFPVSEEAKARKRWRRRGSPSAGGGAVGGI